MRALIVTSRHDSGDRSLSLLRRAKSLAATVTPTSTPAAAMLTVIPTV
jgi:hypothetical protein